MNVNKIIKESWRYAIFNIEKKYYCFDCYTFKFFSISDELAGLIKRKKFYDIKSMYPKFYKEVVLKRELSSKVTLPKKEKQCKVTINLSNNCNLNCIYCYRNKTEKTSLSEKQIEEIFQYLKYDYMPNADCYILSFCNTSESSLDLEKLKFVDKMIAKYEGNYFSEKNIAKKQLLRLYNRLPEEIQKRHPLGNVFSTLNNILETEKLWKIYDYSNNDYLKSVITENDLSLSRSVMANRSILNNLCADLKLERPIKYISFWFMTNGTNITDEYIHFIISIFMKEVTVSIDGNEEIHNFSRKYKNGKGSFVDTINGIRKLQENGIAVKASITITPAYPKFIDIIDYLNSIGISKFTFNLVRGTKENCFFDEKAISILINSWKKIYQLVYDEIRLKEFHYLKLLKGCYAFSIINRLYFRKYMTERCGWNNELVIDSKGRMYHCNSTIGIENDYLGNYIDKKSIKKIKRTEKNVDNDERCKKCNLKYLCGGTCYANDLFQNTNGRDQECFYKREIIKEGLILYAKLYKNGLLKDFLRAIN